MCFATLITHLESLENARDPNMIPEINLCELCALVGIASFFLQIKMELKKIKPDTYISSSVPFVFSYRKDNDMALVPVHQNNIPRTHVTFCYNYNVSDMQ